MITARGLTKRYGDTTAVDAIDFTVKPGSVTGFLGPNGAGKSTTMRMVTGLDHPTSGTVTVNGRSYRDHPAPLHEVGCLLEAKAIHGGRSAYNHLLWLAKSNGISRGRVDEVIGLVGLEDVAHKRAGAFSLGMGQRLGIAAALLGDPGVLLFDEPVNGLDPEGIRWIRTLIRNLAADGRTVFVSSHLMSEMALTADHLLVIGRGKILADTNMADFIARNSTEHVLVRSPHAARLTAELRAKGWQVEAADDNALTVYGASMEQIGDVAGSHGLFLYELRQVQASLEEAFMRLTADSVEFHAGRPAEPAPAPATAGSPANLTTAGV
ncbi:ABC transporter ATP-binding protein [Phytoactinopolyspora mesophila]|uniref:ATP-binding cassette domain-containing protein n=1 Tax=Phytoactinopolyspora mesophila TaxID=2650750 RepID=A0A7K3M4Y0_9ACTN|nr:ATP-binding cassette domain-containing protein [Phytoactinopolyspora mesophila]NDL58371.1 ATP-binding cassette domain-containing protein [Phytoactinopolyspora mesophila]